jgi:hypothetical protein
MTSRQTHEVKSHIRKTSGNKCKESMAKSDYMLDDTIELTLRGQGGLELGSPLSEVLTWCLGSSSCEFNNHINSDSSVSDIKKDVNHITHPPPTPPPTLAAACTPITAPVTRCHTSRITPSTAASVHFFTTRSHLLLHGPTLTCSPALLHLQTYQSEGKSVTT